MRIIGGSAKGTRLRSVPRHGVRPTLDRVREGVFNVLAPVLSGARFLDLFAGTGAVGLEALSRGAAGAVFVERRGATCRLIQENARLARLQDRTEIRRADAFRSPAWREADATFDLVYLDPPFPLFRSAADLGRLERLVEQRIFPTIAPGGLVLLEHPVRSELRLDRSPDRVLRYGETAIALYEL